jgi:DNA-directed RNA polymerase specialized sigma24 family protein
MFTEAQLIDGIRKRDNKVLTYVYKQYYPMIRFLITSNSGNAEDATDIFHESIIVLYLKLSTAGFKLDCAVRTYLYAVSKNLWLQHLELRRRHISLSGRDDLIASEKESFYDDEKITRKRIYLRQFRRLSDSCRKIINMLMEGADYKDLMAELKYRNKKYAIKRKYECLKTLHDRIMEDPEYRELMK